METEKPSTNSRRKEEHLRIALNEDVTFRGLSTGFDEYYLVHQALPELDLRDVDISTTFLGHRLHAPLMISPMVGGIEEAARINRNLGTAAQAAGIAMSVGSLRCAIEDPALVDTYRVRVVAPDVLLFANLGAVQLNHGYGPRECSLAMEMIEADALTLHLNPLQEALQTEGNTNFSGLLDRIAAVCEAVEAPVFIKEVGWGISDATARRLFDAGVAGIDVAGAGGTCWSEVERLSTEGRAHAAVARAFAEWGIPTAQSIRMARQVELPLIASGGIRTGVDVAKALALGADIAGIATPLLKAANVSPESALSFIEEVVEELRIAMFCVGIGSIKALKDTPNLKRRGTQ